jgi:ATP-binding cassette, subfamily B, multidrug efflux pump
MRGQGTKPAPSDGETLYGKLLDRTLLLRSLSFVTPYRWQMLVALCLLPLSSVFELAQPYLLKVAIDEHIAAGKLDGLDRIGALYLLALLAQYAVLFGQVYLMQRVGQQAMSDLRRAVYRHVLRLSQAFFDRTPIGRLMTRLTSDIESLTEMFAAGIVSLITDVLKLGMILVAIFALDVRLAFFSLATAPILFGIAWIFRKLVREAFRAIRTRVAILNTFVQEHLSGIRVVQAFAQEERTARQFDERNRDLRQASARAISSDAALYAVVEAVGAFAVAALLWHGGGRIFANTLTFGVLVAFIEYLTKFFAPIRDLSTKFTVMQQAMASSERIFELLDSRDLDAPMLTVANTATPAPAGQVVFDDVGFSYRSDTPVLDRVSFQIQAGQTVAIVGPTGAGKSTIIKLMLRLFDPVSGRVLLDGQDLRLMPVETLRRRMVLVGQDPFLFSGTLSESVGIGRQTDTGAIRNAIVNAGGEAFLQSRPEGLAANVSERGGNFSSGERQILALARAFACDPEILILDEATASVDPRTERLIEDATSRLLQGRTALVIAHRFSTIARADHILVIENGRVSEAGTRADLLALGGTFARLWALQSGGGLLAGHSGQQSPA